MTKSPKEKTKHTYNVFSAPEGEPTFIDPTTGRERKLQRVHLARAYTKKEAIKQAEEQNWDNHVQKGEPLYIITTVEKVD